MREERIVDRGPRAPDRPPRRSGEPHRRGALRGGRVHAVLGRAVAERVALAGYVADARPRRPAGARVGCGLALPSFAAALAGADVLATDWAPEALDLAARNAAANGLRIETALSTGAHRRRRSCSPFDVVLAADVLYEERNAVPLLGLLDAATADGGHGADRRSRAPPRRRRSSTRRRRARAAGRIERVPGERGSRQEATIG